MGRRLTIREYREKYPDQTQNMSDYDLTHQLWLQQGKGRDFYEFSREFHGVPSTPEQQAAKSPPDRSPKPQPYVQDGTGLPGDDPVNTLEYLGYKSHAAWDAGWASIFQGADDVADMFTQTFFGENSVLFEKAADELLTNAEKYDQLTKDYDASFAEEVLAEAIGGAIPGILEFAGNVPWAVLREYAAGVKDPNINGLDVVKNAVVQGGKRYVMGRIFGFFGRYGKPAAMVGNAVVFGAETAAFGGDQREVAKAAATGVLYGLLHKKQGAKGVKEAREALDKTKLEVTPEKETQQEVEMRNPDNLGDIVASEEGDRRGAKRRDATDRRDTERRKKLSEEYTKEELILLRKTDEMTQHPNGIAFDESTKKPVQVVTDVNNLKWFNDTYGWNTGDAIIKAKAEALKEAGLDKDSYRLHGDEFAAQFETAEQANAMMKKAQEIFGKKEILIRDKQGNEKLLTGLKFTFGVGEATEVTNEAGVKIKREAHEVAVDKFNETKKAEQEAGLRVEREGRPKGLQEKEVAEKTAAEPQDGRTTKDEYVITDKAKELAEEISNDYADHFNADGELIQEYEPSKALNLKVEKWDTTEGARFLANAIAEANKKALLKKHGIRKPMAVTEKQLHAKVAELVGSNRSAEAIIKAAKKARMQLEDKDAEVGAWKTILASHTERLDRMFDQALSETGTDIDVVRAYAQLDLVRKLQGEVAGMQAHGARITTAARLTVSGREIPILEITPDMVNASIEVKAKVNEVIRRTGGKDALARLRKDWKKSDKFKDRMKVIRKMGGSKIINFLVELRAVNMLSSIKTQVVNFTSNIGHLTMDAVDNYTAAAIGTLSKGERMTFQEANLRAHAAFTGLLNGFVVDPLKGLRTVDLKSGKRLERFEKFAESRGPDPYVRADAEGLPQGAISSEYLRGVTPDSSIGAIGWRMFNQFGRLSRAVSFGLMNLSDSTVKAITYNMETRGLLFREAMRRGVKREDVPKWIETNQRLVEAYRDGKEISVSDTNRQLIHEIHSQSLAKARYITWQEEMSPGMMRRIEQGLKESPAWRLIIPFYKTPMNLLRQIPRRIPGLHLFSDVVKADIQAGGVRRAQAYARLVTGTATLAAVAGLQASGRLVGGIDPKERETYRQAGIPEYSIDLGPVGMVQFNRYDPVGAMMGLVADSISLIDKMDDMDAAEVTWALVGIGGNNLFSKTWATTLADLFAVIREPERYGATFLEKYRNTLVLPLGGLFRSAQEYTDPLVRDTSTFIETAKATYGLSSTPRVDEFGEVIPRQSPVLGSTRMQPRTDSPVRMEMAYLHIPGKPSIKKLYGIEVSKAEEQEILKILKELGYEEAMNKIVTDPSYPKEVGARKQILTDTRNSYWRAAIEMWLSRKEGKIGEVVDKKKEDIEKYIRPAGKAERKDWREFVKGGRL